MTWTLMMGFLALRAQETTDADNLADARETLRKSLNALRTTYTAEIEFDVPDLAELENKPSISYKQRLFEDGTADVQADMEHIPLPEDAPPGLDELSFGFLHTTEGNALRLGNDAIMRDGQGDEEDPFAQMLNQLNEIPIPSDEELAAMDLRQETEVIDGVECQVLSWIPQEYNADDPKSVAMHCVAFGAGDHLLRSYTALNDQGEPMFALRFKDVNTNPSFGPDDFAFGPTVRVVHVKTDEEFQLEVQKLFMKKFVQTALKPKKKRSRRHTASTTSPVAEEPPAPPPEAPAPAPPPAAPEPAPAPPPRRHGLLAFGAGVLLALLVTAGLLFWQKRKNS